jgi:hypothetical protein
MALRRLLAPSPIIELTMSDSGSLLPNYPAIGLYTGGVV